MIICVIKMMEKTFSIKWYSAERCTCDKIP